MESQSQKIISILEEIITILSLCDLRACECYRKYLEKILLQLNRPHELQKVAADILKIFGGMGSFNDNGIYKDSKLLREEDIKFEDLANKLFAACEKAVSV